MALKKNKGEKEKRKFTLKMPKLGTVSVLAAALAVFLAAFYAANSPFGAEDNVTDGGYMLEYENAIVTEVIEDTSIVDTELENVHRGSQLLQIRMLTGRYKGEYFDIKNYLGALYDTHAEEGTRLTVSVATYPVTQEGAEPEISIAVYDYDRSGIVIGCIAVLLLVTAIVGGKKGLTSIIGLAVTFVCLIWVLIPLLFKGLATVPTTAAVCIYVTVVCFVLLDGISKKTVCAMLGTAGGLLIAVLFTLAAGALSHIDGLRESEIEPLLQEVQQDSPLKLRGIFAAGVMVAALGAVMDVAMNISSALTELITVNPNMTARELFKSGMNIGRDMVGTMTNTLILAFVGSGFTLMMVLWQYDIPLRQMLSSAYLSLEVINGAAGSLGVVLTVPLTALISSAAMGYKQTKGRKRQ